MVPHPNFLRPGSLIFAASEDVKFRHLKKVLSYIVSGHPADIDAWLY